VAESLINLQFHQEEMTQLAQVKKEIGELRDFKKKVDAFLGDLLLRTSTKL